MIEFLRQLFSSDFMPHGHCYLWSPQIVWLHVASDACITLAYYSIPVALVYFVRRRKDIEFNWMFLMFSAFIFGCGTTHLMEVWTVWHGTYRFAGMVKVVTTGLSIATAIALWPLIPRALALPRPALLRLKSQELEEEVRHRKRAQAELHQSHGELESRVRERTAELVRANAALRLSEERYRSLVAATTSVVWTTDGAGQFVEPQASWEAYTGQKWEQHRGAGWAQALHPDDRERVKGVWSSALQDRTVYRTEGRLWHAASGRHHHYVARAVPLLSADGSVREWVGTVTDVDDRKRAEERFRLVVEAAPSAMVMVDSSGRIVLVNSQAERLFGSAREELLDK